MRSTTLLLMVVLGIPALALAKPKNKATPTPTDTPADVPEALAPGTPAPTVTPMPGDAGFQDPASSTSPTPSATAKPAPTQEPAWDEHPADSTAPAGDAPAAAATPELKPQRATVAVQKGDVHGAPSKSAAVSVTLNQGTTIQAFALSPDQKWVQVRVPLDGGATADGWMWRNDVRAYSRYGFSWEQRTLSK